MPDTPATNPGRRRRRAGFSIVLNCACRRRRLSQVPRKGARLSQVQRRLRVDTVDKLGRQPLRRNEGIKIANFLSHSWFGKARHESILRSKVPKIIYQQYRSFSPVRLGRRPRLLPKLHRTESARFPISSPKNPKPGVKRKRRRHGWNGENSHQNRSSVSGQKTPTRQGSGRFGLASHVIPNLDDKDLFHGGA